MKNDLNKNMGELCRQKNGLIGLRLLTSNYLGTVFPEVRDEVGAVFPLEFPDCKGLRLCTSKAKLLA